MPVSTAEKEKGGGGVRLGSVTVVEDIAGERKWWQVVGLKMREKRKN